jgi:hypothetical protein
VTEYPLTLTDIVTWYRSKRRSLEGSGVSLTDVRERTVLLPAAAADFTGGRTTGRINGWVSGEFDFEVIRVSDGKDIFWRHIRVSAIDELENMFVEFIQHLREQD